MPFRGPTGKLTCVLQVKLFYFNMVGFVMILQFWEPKLIFRCDFRPIQAKNGQFSEL